MAASGPANGSSGGGNGEAKSAAPAAVLPWGWKGCSGCRSRWLGEARGASEGWVPKEPQTAVSIAERRGAVAQTDLQGQRGMGGEVGGREER